MRVLLYLKIIFLSLSGFAMMPKTGEIQFGQKIECKDLWVTDRLKCSVTQPKEFTQEEKEIVLQILSQLPTSFDKVYRDIIDSKRVLTFFRHKTGREKYKFRYKSDPNEVAWVERFERKAEVHLTDKFFAKDRPINEKHTVREFFMVHELVHVWDNALKITEQSEFLKLTGWSEIETGEKRMVAGIEVPEMAWQIKGVDHQVVAQMMEEVSQLFAQGKIKEGAAKNIKYGQRFGYPTLYSLTNSYEAFAELIANGILAPETMTTVSKDLKNWIETLLTPSK